MFKMNFIQNHYTRSSFSSNFDITFVFPNFEALCIFAFNFSQMVAVFFSIFLLLLNFVLFLFYFILGLFSIFGIAPFFFSAQTIHFGISRFAYNQLSVWLFCVPYSWFLFVFCCCCCWKRSTCKQKCTFKNKL